MVELYQYVLCFFFFFFFSFFYFFYFINSGMNNVGHFMLICSWLANFFTLHAAKAKGQRASVFLRVLKYSTGGVLEVSFKSYFYNSNITIITTQACSWRFKSTHESWAKLIFLKNLGRKLNLKSCMFFTFFIVFKNLMYVFAYIIPLIIACETIQAEASIKSGSCYKWSEWMYFYAGK